MIKLKQLMEDFYHSGRSDSQEWLKKKLLKIYLKSPSKIQFALAKYFLKDIVNKKPSEMEDLIRH